LGLEKGEKDGSVAFKGGLDNNNKERKKGKERKEGGQAAEQ